MKFVFFEPRAQIQNLKSWTPYYKMNCFCLSFWFGIVKKVIKTNLTDRAIGKGTSLGPRLSNSFF